MCTVTLSYDNKNSQAVGQLRALLATGLFTELNKEEEELAEIDYSDPWLWEEHGDLPLPKDKETFTPEEVLEIILDDIHKIYKEDGTA